MARQLRDCSFHVLILCIIVLVCSICLISAEVYRLTKPRRTYFVYDKQDHLVGTKETDIPSDNSSPLDSLSPRLRTHDSNRQQYVINGIGGGINQSNRQLSMKSSNNTFDLKKLLKTLGKNEADFNYQPQCNRAPEVCAAQALCEWNPLSKMTRMGFTSHRRKSRNRSSRKDRITNGEDAHLAEWPQYARITYNHGDNQIPNLCGGVILSERHILTAGHCVGPPEMLHPFEGYNITLGDYTTSNVDPGEQHMKVESVCRAAKYTNNGKNVGNHDWAIITLKGEARFDFYAMPGCLINEYEVKDVPLMQPEAECYVMGFGSLKPVPYGEAAGSDDFPNVLQKMRVEISDCSVYGIDLLDKTRHCFANIDENADSCGGDSGSPVLCKHKDGRQAILGVVSFGRETCDGPSAVFTDIPQLLPDIFKECL